MEDNLAKRNRLIELEQELLKKRAALTGQAQRLNSPVNATHHEDKISPQSQQQSLAPAQPAEAPKQTSRTVQYQVFDRNQPIYLHYLPTSLESQTLSTLSTTPETTSQSEIFPPESTLADTLTLGEASHPSSIVLPAASVANKPQNSSLTLSQSLEDALKTIPPLDSKRLVKALQTLLNDSNAVNSTSLLPTITEQNQDTITESDTQTLSNQLGTDMPYATAFDLGSIKLTSPNDIGHKVTATQQPNKSPTEVQMLAQQFEAFDRLLNQTDQPSTSNTVDQNLTQPENNAVAPKEFFFRNHDARTNESSIFLLEPCSQISTQTDTLSYPRSQSSLEQLQLIDSASDYPQKPFSNKLTSLWARIGLDAIVLIWEWMTFIHRPHLHFNRKTVHLLPHAEISDTNKM